MMYLLYSSTAMTSISTPLTNIDTPTVTAIIVEYGVVLTDVHVLVTVMMAVSTITGLYSIIHAYTYTGLTCCHGNIRYRCVLCIIDCDNGCIYSNGYMYMHTVI